MNNQGRHFNVIISIVSILAILFIVLGAIKFFPQHKDTIDNRPTIPVTEIEIPTVMDKESKWYLENASHFHDYIYYPYFSSDNSSLRDQLINCISAIYYTNFEHKIDDISLKNVLPENPAIEPSELSESLITYNREHDLGFIRTSSFSLDEEMDLSLLEQIVKNNYSVIVWYSTIEMGQKDYFDGWVYWSYAKPLVIYHINDLNNELYAIDPEEGFISINKNLFEMTWCKCGNRALVIG